MADDEDYGGGGDAGCALSDAPALSAPATMQKLHCTCRYDEEPQEPDMVPHGLVLHKALDAGHVH